MWPDNRGPNDNDAAPMDTSGIHLDIHSFSELVLWPWGDRRQTAPNGTAMQTLGRKFAFFNDYYPQQSIGLYATDGTSDAISYGELGVATFTFELGTSFFQNCSTYENTIKPDNLSALIYAAKVTRTPYITPAGPDITELMLSDNASTDGVVAGTLVTITGAATDTRFNNRNGSGSTGDISSYLWDLGDGGSASGDAVSYSYAEQGVYTVTLTVSDASTMESTSAQVSVSQTPPPTITVSLASGSFIFFAWVDVSWSGAQSSQVDIYRDGILLTTTDNDGAYRNFAARGSYTFTVCDAGSESNCSNEVMIDF